MKTLHTFDTLDEAITYRREHGTGGWIFATERNPGYAVIFPFGMTATQVMQHPMSGENGTLHC